MKHKPGSLEESAQRVLLGEAVKPNENTVYAVKVEGINDVFSYETPRGTTEQQVGSYFKKAFGRNKQIEVAFLNYTPEWKTLKGPEKNKALELLSDDSYIF